MDWSVATNFVVLLSLEFCNRSLGGSVCAQADLNRHTEVLRQQIIAPQQTGYRQLLPG